MLNLFFDLESYWHRAEGYTLTAMSAVEYIRDPRFLLQGCGVSEDGGKVFWLRPNEIEPYFKKLNLKETRFINHNAKFDSSIMAWKYGIIAGEYFCTQSAGNAVLGTTVGSMSLDSLAHHYGLEPKGHLNTDGKRVLTPAEESQLIEYGLHDVELLVQIYKELEKDFPKSQYGPMDWTIRTFIQPSLVLDVPLLQQCAVKEKARRDAFFTRPGWEKERFSSNKKFPELLKEHGYEVPTKISPRTGKEIPALALGDPQFLDMLEGDDEKLGEICEARVAAKSTLLETRSGKMAKVGATGKWPFDVWFSGAKQTHRYAGGNAGGGNPQQLKNGSDLRKAVTVPKGMKLICADFSKAEPTIVAMLAGQKNLIKAFANREDVYSQFAAEIYQKPINKKDNPDEYKFGKEGIIAPSYNMGWEKFQKRVRVRLKKNISEAEARQTIDLYRSKYWFVPKYWDYLHSCLPLMADGGFGELKGCSAVKFDGSNIVLPSGLVIRYPNLRQQMVKQKGGGERLQWVYDAYRKAKQKEICTIYGGKLLENIVQALVGEMCKEAIERIKIKHWVAGQNHDEALVPVDESLAEEARQFIQAEMEKTPTWFPGLVLNAEVNIGANWLEAK